MLKMRADSSCHVLTLREKSWITQESLGQYRYTSVSRESRVRLSCSRLRSFRRRTGSVTRKCFKSPLKDTGMALVLVQHLDPKHASMLADLLGRGDRNGGRASQARNAVQPDHVRFPPITTVSLRNGRLRLTVRVAARGMHLPVDTFSGPLRTIRAAGQLRDFSENGLRMAAWVPGPLRKSAVLSRRSRRNPPSIRACPQRDRMGAVDYPSRRKRSPVSSRASASIRI